MFKLLGGIGAGVAGMLSGGIGMAFGAVLGIVLAACLAGFLIWSAVMDPLHHFWPETFPGATVPRISVSDIASIDAYCDPMLSPGQFTTIIGHAPVYNSVQTYAGGVFANEQYNDCVYGLPPDGSGVLTVGMSYGLTLSEWQAEVANENITLSPISDGVPGAEAGNDGNGGSIAISSVTVNGRQMLISADCPPLTNGNQTKIASQVLAVEYGNLMKISSILPGHTYNPDGN